MSVVPVVGMLIEIMAGKAASVIDSMVCGLIPCSHCVSGACGRYAD